MFAQSLGWPFDSPSNVDTKGRLLYWNCAELPLYALMIVMTVSGSQFGTAP